VMVILVRKRNSCCAEHHYREADGSSLHCNSWG
jgi:hypothetical protein